MNTYQIDTRQVGFSAVRSPAGLSHMARINRKVSHRRTLKALQAISRNGREK